MIEQTFHIRKQLAKRGGNQFYRDRSIREAGTLCGEPVTINDIPFKGTVDRSWLANHFPGFEPCSKCLAIRGTQ